MLWVYKMQKDSYVNQNGFQLNDYNRVETLGKGHCLFASFSLGLVDLLFSGELDQAAAMGQFNDFLRFFTETIGHSDHVLSWNEFKEYLAKNRGNTDHLQLFLARTQRKLLIHLMTQSPALPNIMQNGASKDLAPETLLTAALDQGSNLFQSLISEFHDYVITNMPKPRGKAHQKKKQVQRAGDVFNRCHQIKAKFVELFRKITADSSEDVVSLELMRWFCTEGYQYFKQHMATDDGWGGPIEARLLARYWDVTVFTVQKLSVPKFYGQPDCIYNANSLTEGRFLELDEPLRLLLIARGLISREVDAEAREILISDEQDIRESLEPIPESAEIIEVWEAFWEQNQNQRPPKLLWQPDADFSPAILQLLIDRNIINRRNKGYYFNFHNDKEGLMKALSGIETADVIQSMVTLLSRGQNHQKSFVIVNVDAMHWEYYQRLAKPPNVDDNWENNLSSEEEAAAEAEADKPVESTPKVKKATGAPRTKTTSRFQFTNTIRIKRKRDENDVEGEPTTVPPAPSVPMAPTLAIQGPSKKPTLVAIGEIAGEATSCLHELHQYYLRQSINPYLPIAEVYKSLNRFFWYVKRVGTIDGAGGNDCRILLEQKNDLSQMILPEIVMAFIEKHRLVIYKAYAHEFKTRLFNLTKMIDYWAQTFNTVTNCILSRFGVEIITRMNFMMLLYVQKPCEGYANNLITTRRQFVDQCQPHFSDAKIDLSGFFHWYQLTYFKRTNHEEFNKAVISTFEAFDDVFKYLERLEQFLIQINSHTAKMSF